MSIDERFFPSHYVRLLRPDKSASIRAFRSVGVYIELKILKPIDLCPSLYMCAGVYPERLSLLSAVSCPRGIGRPRRRCSRHALKSQESKFSPATYKGETCISSSLLHSAFPTRSPSPLSPQKTCKSDTLIT